MAGGNWDQNSQWFNTNWNYTSDQTGGGAAGYEIPDDQAAGGVGQQTTDFSSFYGSKGGVGNYQQPQQQQQQSSTYYSNPPPPSSIAQKRPSQSSSYGGNVFYPSDTISGGNRGGGGFGGENYDDNIENEPPLLEELGVNFDHIRQKTMAVLNPLKQTDPSVIHDNDLAGPLVFCLLFGGALLLHGKVHFGFIYGIGVLGCLGVYLLLNLMAHDGITLTCTVSVVGYCLLPMSILSLVTAVLSFKGIVGMCISIAAVLWCSLSASKLFVTALSMDHQRWLVAYPCSLLYGVFALMAIF